MASVWKRLQRVGKHASKFQFVASYQELMVECTKKWWVFLGGSHSRPQCCHLRLMKTVCLCLSWNAELVPGGHNLHTDTYTLSLLGVPACLYAGRGWLPCKIAMFLFFPLPRWCWICLDWVLSRQAERFPFNLRGWVQAALVVLKCPWANH